MQQPFVSVPISFHAQGEHFPAFLAALHTAALHIAALQPPCTPAFWGKAAHGAAVGPPAARAEPALPECSPYDGTL